MVNYTEYAKNIERRRSLRIDGFSSLIELGFDGEWVSPYQISSRSLDGPVVIAYNWIDVPGFRANRPVLERLGYLPGMTFNNVLDMALTGIRKSRKDIYLTQAFHLLPQARSEPIPTWALDLSFDAVTKYETYGRRVIAMGTAASRMCSRHGVACIEVPHPSARTGTYAQKASFIASALAATS